LTKVVENDNQTSNNLSTPVSNSNKVEQKNESIKNGESVEDTHIKPQKITKVPNGTSTSVQVAINYTVQQNEYGTHKEDKNHNVVKQNDVEIRDNEKPEKPKKPTSPKTNGNGKVNGKHDTEPNSINSDETSKKRELDSSDDLALNNTTKKRKEDSAVIMKNGKSRKTEKEVK